MKFERTENENGLRVHCRPVLVRDDRSKRAGWAWDLVVDVCPYCENRHRHGGGAYNPKDPGSWMRSMGGRVAHCGSFRWYELIAPAGRKQFK